MMSEWDRWCIFGVNINGKNIECIGNAEKCRECEYNTQKTNSLDELVSFGPYTEKDEEEGESELNED